MVIGINTVHIRVKVPNLLIASNLRELVGGGLCSKGAERSGKVTRVYSCGCLKAIKIKNKQIYKQTNIQINILDPIYLSQTKSDIHEIFRV